MRRHLGGGEKKKLVSKVADAVWYALGVEAAKVLRGLLPKCRSQRLWTYF